MYIRLLCILVLVAASYVSINVVSAAPTITDVTIVISAQVAEVYDATGLLNGQVQVGDTVTGQYTYDLLTPNTSSHPQVGDYWHYEPPNGLVVQVSGLIFQTDPDHIEFLVELVDNHNADNYLVRSYRNLPLSRGVLVRHIAWQLDDPSMTALSTIALPAIEPDLADWQSIFGLTLEGCSESLSTPGECGDFDFFIRAHVTSATRQYCPSFVPPATVGIEDIVAMATRWGWTNTTPGWDTAYDLNGDNKIDIVDISLVTRAWGRTCSSP